jgi:UDP-N-acetyl-D-mannosaminuronic acid dehydrogenase
MPLTGRNKSVCVLGLGYIGLPTASVLATNGFQVIGVDVNPHVVETINRGDIHIEEPGLGTVVQAAINSGRLKASTVPVEADVFIIAVPTPITETKNADMNFVKAAAKAIRPLLKPGNLVVLESTSPPGTTRDLLAPYLAESGLEFGRDLFLAHCPERVLPGKILQELIENHRVIGGLTPACAEKAREIYGAFVAGEMHLTDATTAEMVKVMENTYRDVNIALANELAQLSEGLSISAWDVVKLANLHPRVNLHQPGPGVGGHCISVDPWFIVEQAPETAQLIHMARRINDAMPHHVASQIIRDLEGIQDPKVTILGVAYKGNVDDTRESPALEVLHDLTKSEVQVAIYDPHVQHFEYELHSLEDAFRDSDLVVLLAPHHEYKLLNPSEIGKLMRHRVVFDTRNHLPIETWTQSGFSASLLGNARRAKSTSLTVSAQ